MTGGGRRELGRELGGQSLATGGGRGGQDSPIAAAGAGVKVKGRETYWDNTNSVLSDLEKIDGLASLVADPPQCNSNTRKTPLI